MSRGARVYVLFLRVVLALLPALALVGYIASDRIARLLPQTWWFVVVFALAVIGILAWLEAVTGHWAIEGPIYARALRRVGTRLRLTQPSDE